MAFSPDGKTILAGGDDNMARLWDATTRQQIGEPLRHGNFVTAVAFSPNGKILLTGSRDTTARLWDRRDRSTARATSATSRRGECRGLQSRRQDHLDREPGHERPALGRGDRPTARPPLNASWTSPGCSVLVRRQDHPDRRGGQGRPILALANTRGRRCRTARIVVPSRNGDGAGGPRWRTRLGCHYLAAAPHKTGRFWFPQPVAAGISHWLAKFESEAVSGPT